jgi:hypothetical protein
MVDQRMTEEIKPNNSRSIEIVNTPGVDFIFSYGTTPEIKKLLMDEFQNGLPANYPKYKNNHRVHVDQLDKPRLIVKKTMWNKETIVQIRKEAKPGTDLRYVNAVASVSSDFRMARLIENTMTTPQAQEIAKKYGFQEISLVKPLMAFIQKPDGIKYVVYPFIEGKTWPELDSSIDANGRSHVQELFDLLKNNGINPIDLQNRQIMISGNQMLLTDIEQYYT